MEEIIKGLTPESENPLIGNKSKGSNFHSNAEILCGKLAEAMKVSRLKVGDHVRVSDKYYQRILNTENNLIWKHREKKEAAQDGIEFKRVNKYHGFTFNPDFFDYKLSVNGFLNLFEPLNWLPKAGELPTIKKLFQHIFSEHLEIGYDYIYLLLTRPKQQLPILVIVSKEQGTGKSTFLYFMQQLFGNNAVIMKVAEYVQQFNALYACKLVIGVDETILSGEGVKEKIKADSTAKYIQLRKMHSEHETIPFFGKFILCSNAEKNFANVDAEDIRFFVRKINTITDFDEDFETKLNQEIPAFLDFILNRPMHTPKPLSRMWFSAEQIVTDALLEAAKESRSEIVKELEIFIADTLEDKISFKMTASELHDALGKKYTRPKISTALKELGYSPSEYPVDYTSLTTGTLKRGRAYSFEMTTPTTLLSF